jgi:uncharacterized protein YecE (DUF72 family)
MAALAVRPSARAATSEQRGLATMKLRVGTSGYSYKEWKGSFYPSDLPAAKMLDFYAKQFSTVEINNTFYRMPTEKVLLNWSEQVPKDFAFVLKVSKRISHDRRLKNVSDDVAYFLKTSAVLGAKRGPLLIQLPPFLKKDLATLVDFLKLLPADAKPAFEFRNQSWFDDEVLAALREHKAALCLAEAENDLEIPFVSTAPWGYVRLRRPDYGDSELREWVKRIRDQSWKEAYVFFKHEDAGKGPQFAKRFLELAGA